LEAFVFLGFFFSLGGGPFSFAMIALLYCGAKLHARQWLLGHASHASRRHACHYTWALTCPSRREAGRRSAL